MRIPKAGNYAGRGAGKPARIVLPVVRFANQVNNVLAILNFPRSTGYESSTVNLKMKIAAVQAIASLVNESMMACWAY